MCKIIRKSYLVNYRFIFIIKGLGGEKINWGKKAKEFRESLKSITGDIILSSGIIAYLGAFMMGYRDQSLKAW